MEAVFAAVAVRLGGVAEEPAGARNLLLGCRTYNQIAARAPGPSRALLTRRLRELERAGLVVVRPKADGRGSRYEPNK